MTYLTDSSRTIAIEMYEGDNEVDFSPEFFNVGSLPLVYTIRGINVYGVDNVYDCVMQSDDWEQGVGDYEGDDTNGRKVILDWK